MRSIEILVREYPDKTCKEIIEIQEQEKREADEYFKKIHQAKIDFANDINTNGGYFRGKFGVGQHYYYRIYNCEVENNGKLIGDVEEIVGFNRDNDRLSISIEKTLKEYRDLETYSLTNEERITKKEWDELNDYLNKCFTKFWK